MLNTPIIPATDFRNLKQWKEFFEPGAKPDDLLSQ